MKKRNLLFLLTLLLVGCNKDIDSLTILAPTGAPSLAFYDYLNTNNFQTNSTPKNIIAKMNENGSDIIVIDTIKGIQTINEGAPYKIAANITFGNFYIASTGNDDNNTMDKDDHIVLFNKGQTPDKIFHYIYGEGYNITYVDSVTEANKCLANGKTLDLKETVDYVFIAQPVLSSTLANNENVSVYANIQQLYKEKTNNDLIQAAIFVKDGTDDKLVDEFLQDINNDVNALLENPDLLLEKTANIDQELLKSKLGVNVNLAYNTIKNNNTIGIGFKYVKDNIESVSTFLELFNLTLNEEDIY